MLVTLPSEKTIFVPSGHAQDLPRRQDGGVVAAHLLQAGRQPHLLEEVQVVRAGGAEIRQVATDKRVPGRVGDGIEDRIAHPQVIALTQHEIAAITDLITIGCGRRYRCHSTGR